MTDPERPRTSDMLGSIRDAVEDLAEKAGPVVRDLSAKAADAVAVAADRAAPLVQRAGAATADASERLAERSRTFAAGVRESSTSDHPADGGVDPAPAPADIGADDRLV